MKKNVLNIGIEKPIDEIFIFVTDPNNTHLWIPFIVKEETNEWPPKVGTIYRNQDSENRVTELITTIFEPDNIFELMTKDGCYHVRYTLSPNSDSSTNLEYLEWVDDGELEHPFSEKILRNLKSTIEK